MLLRQYFMSLKVLDRWTHLGPHMSTHWDKVASNVAKSHPCLPPQKPSTPAPGPVEQQQQQQAQDSHKSKSQSKSSWDHWTPANMRARRSSVVPLSEKDTDVDRDSSPETEGNDARLLEGIAEDKDEEDTAAADEERELQVMRRVFRRWCRKAGVHAQAAGEIGDEEIDCDWTKAIKPQVEGRIVMVGEGA